MQDLNTNPKLPFEDNSFDVITNVVCGSFSSSEYLVLKQLIFNMLIGQGLTSYTYREMLLRHLISAVAHSFIHPRS